MQDTIDNKKSINLPHYINIPLFLYQDQRLEKPAMLIAAFFYSIHSSGSKITASTDYLCAIAGIHKRQFYRVMNSIEECGYITRAGFTNRKIIKWTYRPESKITVNELSTSVLEDTSVQQSNTSVIDDSKLVSSKTLNLCHPRHTDNKEDTKDYKKLTTVEEPVDKNPSSSSFFSEKQSEELLSYKIKKDERTDEVFLSHCQHHMENQDNDYGKFERFTGLKHILVKLYETQDIFKAKGFGKIEAKKEERTTPPTKEDFDNYKKCVPGYEWVNRWLTKNA